MRSKSRYKFILLTTILFLSALSTSNAQKKAGQALIDSLLTELSKAALDTNKVNLLYRTSYAYRNIDQDEGVKYGEQGFELANQINWKKGKALTLNSIGVNYFLSSAYDEAIPKLLQAFNYAEQLQLWPTMAQSAMVLGLSYDRTYQFEAAGKYYQKSIEPYKKTGSQNVLTALSNAAYIYNRLAKFSQALAFANEHYEYIEKNGPESRKGKALDLLGDIYLDMSNYPLALQYFFDALRVFEKFDDRAKIADALLSIGVVYQTQVEFDKALEYYNNALVIFRELEDIETTALTLTNIGSVYHLRKEYKKAQSFYEQALEIYEGFENHENLAQTLYNIGGIILEDKEYAKALEWLERALVSADKTEDHFQAAVILGYIGAAYHQIGITEDSTSLATFFNGSKVNALEAGLVYTDSAIAILAGLKELKNQAFYIDQRSIIQADLGRYDKALESYKLFTQINDSLFNIERDRKLVQSEMGYEFGRREDSLKLESTKQQLALQKEIELQTLTFEYQKKEAAAQSEQEKQQLAYEENLKRQDIQNEYARKQAEAQALNQQRDLERKQAEALNQAELRRQRIIRNLSLIGASGLLVFSFVVFRQRNKVKREKARSEELLLNILPAEIAEELKIKGKADARDFEMVSILFTDFKEFTKASAVLSAQDLVTEINHCFEAFDNIMEKYGIEKIKTIGDAYMAAGGLPVPSDDSTKNTVLAALEMQQFVSTRKTRMDKKGLPAFEMRVGIHTGPVVAGIVGVKKFQYDIWGDTVNTASRMESNGEIGKVNISQTTYEVLKNDTQFTIEGRGRIEAKGKGQIEMYFIQHAP